MTKRFPFVGIARCRRCGLEFPMRSGIHAYCTPACRAKDRKSHRRRGPRTYVCIDCGIEGAAGKSGPLPHRCPDCKRRHDCRPERVARKRANDRRRKEKT